MPKYSLYFFLFSKLLPQEPLFLRLDLLQAVLFIFLLLNSLTVFLLKELCEHHVCICWQISFLANPNLVTLNQPNFVEIVL